jgi:predicted DNA binding CopG/RHH family protein
MIVPLLDRQCCRLSKLIEEVETARECSQTLTKQKAGVSGEEVRPRNITIRLSEEDYQVLTKRAEEAGMTQSEYVRLLIRRARIRLNVEV